MYAQKNYLELPLTKRGKQVAVALVDASDYNLLKDYRWKLHTNGYAMRNVWVDGVASIEYMHRVITQATKGKVVDHINHNTLDNRKSNLRLCEHRENMRNTKLSKNSTSGYTGVVWHKTQSSWQARIRLNYKTIFLGYYNNLEDAVKARKLAEKKYFGNFAFKEIL